MSDTPQGFEAMKARLDEIVDEVSAEGVSLDEALALYEEAVKLGLSACDVSEADILVVEDEYVDASEGVDGEVRDASPQAEDAAGGQDGADAPSQADGQLPHASWQAQPDSAENGQA